MQLTLLTAALAATVAATSSKGDDDKPKVDLGSARVVNRCPYPVWLWAIQKQMGCSPETAVKLETGDVWSEPFSTRYDNGISVKISKWNTCAGKDITQLEYKIDQTGIGGNFVDMSFVDCTKNLEDCPGRTDGFYLKSGSQKGISKSAVNNEHCPVFNVYNAEEAARVSYILPDDRQTKWCQEDQDLDLYLCGGEAPGAENEYSPEPVSSASPSSEVESTPSPSSTKQQKPKPTPPAPSTTEDAFIVAAAAAVTQAPEAPVAPVIKTEVVYVTEYVNRRHAHGRRHQRYHA